MNDTILIIEDNEQNIYLMRFLLEKNGFQVAEARSAQEGIVTALSGEFLAILLDIQLPDKDGYAVARELRGHGGLKETPIIAVTSYAMTGDKEKALEAGCTGYIEKPIDSETFIDDMKSHFVLQGKEDV